MRLIWTKRALERHAAGKATPSHTISAPNVADAYGGFVRQMRAGTPWALVNAAGTIVASGLAGQA